MDIWPRLCRSLRLVALIAGGVYVAALSINWEGFGHGLAFRSLLATRLGTGITFLGLAYASRPSWPRRRVHLFFLATILLMVATRLLESPTLRAHASTPAEVLVFPVMPLIIFAVIAIPARLVVAWSLVGSLLFLRDQVALHGMDAPVTRLLFLYLLLANGAGYAFRVAWNRITRRDYAVRRELEYEAAERQRAEQEARQANAAKSFFLTVMSHEIRTPLNGVLGAIQLIQETPVLPEQRRPMEILSHSGNQLALLLDDILDLARIEAGHVDLMHEVFSPAELLASIHAMLSSQAQTKGLTLRQELAADLPAALVGDALRLRQVLINLAGNAVKFTDQGEVVLALTCAQGPPGALTCCFAVRDTGPGLSEDAQRLIFAPFEQGDPSIHRHHGGAGLGLAISHKLVAAMGGALSVTSELGHGSIFRFTLDLPVGEALPAPPPASSAPRSLSVLVVDDLEANLIVAQGLLESLGHRVRTAASGAEALAILRAEVFDTVLLDLHMEDMEGMDVFRHIQGEPRTTHLPVFLVTADTERTQVQACLAEGIRGVLAKPVRKAKLAALLAGIPVPAPAAVRVAPSLVEVAQVAQLVADLGRDIWSAGLQACRASAGACLKDLGNPAALHRLAGLSASYGMLHLHQEVRRAEALVASGSPCPLEELRALTASSLDRLEAVTRELP